jgi:hypothetical protein
MSWRDLLQAEEERLVAPWVGGRSLRSRDRTWTIQGRNPPEPGWHTFKLENRKARWLGVADTPNGVLKDQIRGYLVGDRLVPDGVRVSPENLGALSERIYLIEPGLDRFVRVVAGRFFEDGPLIYEAPEFPLGPEDAVMVAFEDQLPNVNAIPGVSPALDVAFRLESWRREEIERRRREEQERREREERDRLAAERRQQLIETLGDGNTRRAHVEVDFAEAARAALAVGGAQYLSHRESHHRDEMVVRYRVDEHRLECTCDRRSLRIIDSGICLTDHRTGQKGDTFFTLESLPAVVRQADREHKLVVYRHV